MKAIEIGKLLRAGTTGFVFGCRINQLEAPSFAALVSAELGNCRPGFRVDHRHPHR